MPGDIVVMENLSVHRQKRVQDAIEQTSAAILYLPPYSPELNPIEKAWAKLKDYLRRVETRTRDAFDTALAEALQTLSPEDFRAWVNHSGYEVKAM